MFARVCQQLSGLQNKQLLTRHYAKIEKKKCPFIPFAASNPPQSGKQLLKTLRSKKSRADPHRNVPVSRSRRLRAEKHAMDTQQRPTPAPDLTLQIVKLIDHTAEWCALHGPEFEQVVRRQNYGKPGWEFLNECESPAKAYFRSSLDYFHRKLKSDAMSAVAGITDDLKLVTQDVSRNAVERVAMTAERASADAANAAASQVREAASYICNDISAAASVAAGSMDAGVDVLSPMHRKESDLEMSGSVARQFESLVTEISGSPEIDISESRGATGTAAIQPAAIQPAPANTVVDTLAALAHPVGTGIAISFPAVLGADILSPVGTALSPSPWGELEAEFEEKAADLSVQLEVAKENAQAQAQARNAAEKTASATALALKRLNKALGNEVHAKSVALAKTRQHWQESVIGRFRTQLLADTFADWAQASRTSHTRSAFERQVEELNRQIFAERNIAETAISSQVERHAMDLASCEQSFQIDIAKITTQLSNVAKDKWQIAVVQRRRCRITQQNFVAWSNAVAMGAMSCLESRMEQERRQRTAAEARVEEEAAAREAAQEEAAKATVAATEAAVLQHQATQQMLEHAAALAAQKEHSLALETQSRYVREKGIARLRHRVVCRAFVAWADSMWDAQMDELHKLVEKEAQARQETEEAHAAAMEDVVRSESEINKSIVPIVARYRVLERSVIRATSEMSSPKLGETEVGTIVEAFEVVTNMDGVQRVHFSGGWTSVATKAGVRILRLLDT